MLRSLKDLEEYKVSATDGDVGKVVNFLLDDERWTVRYLVVETGGTLDGRQVLISPISFRRAEWATQRFHLALTMDKIRHSPGVDADRPFSRQLERDYSHYFGYSYYWGLPGIWGMGAMPGQLGTRVATDEPGESAEDLEAPGDIHLRSAREIRGYHIQGTDDAIGHVEDFVVDDETWAVRYLVIDTSNWWFGKKVLVSPRWASRVSWGESKVHVELTRAAIQSAPEWTPDTPINREYETRLYDYHGKPVYWDRPEVIEVAPRPPS